VCWDESNAPPIPLPTPLLSPPPTLPTLPHPTERAGMECIRYLKENQLPPMTFLPVQTIKAKEINTRLNSLGGTARLALHCLDVKEPRVMRVYEAVCG
jgi:chromosome segregation ATPase